MILNICAILLISSWYWLLPPSLKENNSLPNKIIELNLPTARPVSSSLRQSEAKYGRIPSRSMMFIPPLMNLILWGAAMNLMTYSNVNQPTNTASAISKKSSSPVRMFTMSDVTSL